jgi:hypothetical protein
VEGSPTLKRLSTLTRKNVYVWAARQFQQEARSASTATRRKSVSESRKHTPSRHMEMMKSAPVYSVDYFSHEAQVLAFDARQLRKSFNTKVFGGKDKPYYTNLYACTFVSPFTAARYRLFRVVKAFLRPDG